jgi:hypothetical protein
MTLFLTILSVAAFAVAVVALSLAVAVAKQSGAVASTLQRHRLAHAQESGAEDPGAWDGDERRRLNLGPPRATGERRRRERPPVSAGQLTVDDTPTEEREAAGRPQEPQTAQIRRQLPRPGQLGQRQ